jgi:hypothetical protein
LPLLDKMAIPRHHERKEKKRKKSSRYNLKMISNPLKAHLKLY